MRFAIQMLAACVVLSITAGIAQAGLETLPSPVEFLFAMACCLLLLVIAPLLLLAVIGIAIERRQNPPPPRQETR